MRAAPGAGRGAGGFVGPLALALAGMRGPRPALGRGLGAPGPGLGGPPGMLGPPARRARAKAGARARRPRAPAQQQQFALPAGPAGGVGALGAAALGAIVPFQGGAGAATADPLASYYERWLDLSMEPQALQLQLPHGTVLEAATIDAARGIDGTCLLVCRRKYNGDAVGAFFESAFAGASNPQHAVYLDASLSGTFPLAQSPAIAHWCVQGPANCPATAPSRNVLHLQWIRVRQKEHIQEPWVQDVAYIIKICSDADGIKPDSKKEKAAGKEDDDSVKVRELKKRLLEYRKHDPTLSPADRLTYASASHDLDDAEAEERRARKFCGSSSSLFWWLHHLCDLLKDPRGGIDLRTGAENVRGMSAEDLATVEEVLGLAPVMMCVSIVGWSRRPRDWWLPWKVRFGDDFRVEPGKEGRCYYRVVGEPPRGPASDWLRRGSAGSGEL